MTSVYFLVELADGSAVYLPMTDSAVAVELSNGTVVSLEVTSA